MTITELQNKISTPYFTTLQVQKLFPSETAEQINTQLNRMTKRSVLIHLKRGIFLFPNLHVDDFFLANILYPQSYVSLESALNTYGMMPDIPAQVTSVTPLTSKKIETSQSTFLYSKINTNLYFGFQQHSSNFSSPWSQIVYHRLAEPEKALLDYIYIRHVTNLEENRISLESIDRKLLRKYAESFPDWVKKAIL